MEFVRCSMADNMAEPMEGGRKCAAEILDGGDVDWPAIKRCASGPQGEHLLKEYGEQTHALRPKVSFIPTIAVDSSLDGQKSLLKNFLLEVCRKFQVRNPSVLLKAFIVFFSLREFSPVDVCLFCDRNSA